MGNETIALIDTHNYGGVTLSFDESIDVGYLSFLSKGEIQTTRFPVVCLFGARLYNSWEVFSPTWDFVVAGRSGTDQRSIFWRG